jgi:hypothetical protein
MYHASLFVQVLQSLGDLDNDVSREILAEVGQPDDLVEELAARAQLENDIVVLSRFCEVDELNDIRVI